MRLITPHGDKRPGTVAVANHILTLTRDQCLLENHVPESDAQNEVEDFVGRVEMRSSVEDAGFPS